MSNGRPVPLPSGPRAAPLWRYAAAVVITMAAILSQYVLPEAFPALASIYGNLPGGFFVVYGIPIMAFAFLVGAEPLRRYADQMQTATIEGLRWFGLLSLLALVVTLVLAVVYEALDPGALHLLEKPNPELTAAAGDPWLYIGISFVAGAFEETIFRGWIFGVLVQVDSGRWPLHAVWTSALFAGAHLYYGSTYGAASALLFPTLFFLGLAFALTYRASGENLVVVSLLHGVYDGAAFLSIVSVAASEIIRYGLIAAGLAIALGIAIRRPWAGRGVAGLGPPLP